MKNNNYYFIKIIISILLCSKFIYSNSEEKNLLSEWSYEENIDLLMEVEAEVIVPLQIITDLNIKATVIDNQKLEIPFKLEMNKDSKKTYKLSYSENLIDIDNDGVTDIQISSPELSSDRVVENNKIIIYGNGIKNDGLYRKKIYITIELKDGY